ncbi:N-methylhydantoinase B [Dictyobacter sp. S3.2.2.5]|uniref:N-methylhydantoinase B n=1 Tax=Dictyobacter halimunensis TaxID=3026934 RepID=A0ABQ6FS95_9CHLR|nr:N-methylhydantoinase B [Dictyobacter sp. S3.2.2.5]
MSETTHVTPISLEIFRSALTAIAEEMGTVLMLSSYSPNIKERRDFSCALFDTQGRLVAQAAHIPVHLGAMPDSVASALSSFDDFAPGDIIALNDPFLGGSHLPDITLIAPIYVEIEHEPRLVGFAANRAHHSDVGGMSPGSMPLANEIYQEGIIIPPVKLWEAGQPNQPLLTLLLRNVRTPHERRGDLTAQVAANRTAIRRMQELVERWSLPVLDEHVEALIEYARRITHATIGSIPDGSYSFEDYLDNDGISDEPVKISVEVTVDGDSLSVDFSGSSPQVRGNINTVAAVARSAAYYVVRCLMPDDAPMNHGTFAPVTVIAPEGTVVNARPPAGVAQGNVETSQRVTDAIFGALAQALPDVIASAGQGTMNNITAGGIDPRSQQPFAYYETMGGGMGAGPRQDGLSGVHVHMSNTLNTPVEAFEYAYPMRISRYQLRDNSGGEGQQRGGDGLVREITFEVPTDVTLLSERRRFAPYGLRGGLPGQRGENRLLHDGQETILPGKARIQAAPGDRLIIASPGGGGWGAPSSIDKTAK